MKSSPSRIYARNYHLAAAFLTPPPSNRQVDENQFGEMKSAKQINCWSCAAQAKAKVVNRRGCIPFDMGGSGSRRAVAF